MIRVLRNCLLVLALLGALPAARASADSVVKVRLVSGDAMEDVEGTATLHGQKLSGHLIGNGIDVMLTGLVKNQSVSVEVVGRILPSCGLHRQSMSGTGDNENEATSIDLTLTCLGNGVTYLGNTYHFHLDLALPSHPLYSPPPDPGESASLE